MRPSIFTSVPGLRRFSASLGSAFPRKLQIIAAAALLCAPVLSFGAAPAIVQPQVVHGHVPKAVRKLAPLHRLEANRRMQITIGLPLRNSEALTNLLQDIYNPSSPNYRHFLGPDEFAAKFGPSKDDYQKVIDFAKAHGLIVKRTHSNRTLLDVEGSVADLEKALHVHMQVYKHPTEARNFFSADAEPSLDLDTPVLAISGLDNYVKPRPHLHLAGASPKIRPMGGGGGGGGGTGSYTGPFEGYDFRDAYAPNISQDGTGQSVGLFELFGYNIQDIEDYENDAGISPVTVTPITIDGGSADDSAVNNLDQGDLDYAFEVTGDIEMAIAMAPGLSNVLVYIGPTPQDQPPLGTNYIQDATTTAQINDVLNRMATDDLAKQLSCSYGMDINLSTVQIFQQYAAQGQSFFLASGDAGAYSSAVDQPADDPNITVVGGTILTENSTATNNMWGSEVAWLSPPGDDGLGDTTPLEDSGGGISMAHAIPWWQQGISMTANQGSTTMRNVPDVSLVADNITIFWGNTLVGTGDGGDALPFPVNGTSMAAPLWAAFMACVNQAAAENSQPPVGFLNPTLYAIGKSKDYPSCFHDITSGCNTNASSPTKYFATTGYDLCTGWGTINTNLMQALLSPPADGLLITNGLGFTAQGPSGGPFDITSRTYTVLNTSSTPVTWSLANTSSWLNVSSSGGTLNPGNSAAVTVSLNSNVTNFLIDQLSGNVVFSNLSAGTIQNRQFDLYVGNGGFEAGSFDDWTLNGDSTLTFPLAADDADIAGRQALPGQPDELFVRSGLWGGYLGNWPDNGTLSQTVPTQAGQTLLVSFWLTSVPDPNSNNIPNGFTAKWNGSAFFTGTNLPAFGWQNIQYIVSASGTSGTLEFDFNNTPGAFGLDDVTVEPVPALAVNSVSGGNITLSWSAAVNSSYQIQSTTGLGGVWTNVGSPIIATNRVMSISLPISNNPQTFYRFIILP